MTREWLKNADFDRITFSADFIPKASDRAKWESLSESTKNRLISEGEKYLSFEFYPMSATEFLRFKREGNRGNYESLSLEKRDALTTLVLAECAEYKGRFIDKIIDGIWSIYEESFWGMPAHNDGLALPDTDHPIIDIFAAQTASTVCLSVYMLGDELSAEAPQIISRVKSELDRRMFAPFTNRTDFWWMGYERKDINNWNPWILSSLITPFIIYGRRDCIEKAIYLLDPYLNYIDGEGSCDEGVTYWNLGALCLFDFLEALYLSTDGAINFFNEEKIQNIFSFAEKMYIGKGQFVNYADSAPFARLDSRTVFRMGKRIQSDETMAFAKEQMRYVTEKNEPEYKTLKRSVLDAFAERDIEAFDGNYNGAERCHYLRDIEVVTCKRGKVFFAVKGGSNAENHNHNDVGNIIYYFDDEPILIDIGAPVYDARSFSDRRYEIFSNQSDYHNVPKIDGTSQHAGQDTHTAYFNVDGEHVTLDASACYGKKFSRTVEFDGRLHITDEFDGCDVSEHFITAQKPEIDGSSVIIGGVRLICKNGCDIKVEEIPLTDTRLINSWGDRIYRVIFTIKNCKKAEFTI